MSSKYSTDVIDILVVEDNPGDIRLIEEAFAEDDCRCRLHVTKDGSEALAFLRQEGAFDSAPRPAVILLDLNLPRKSGSEVLETVKSDRTLKRIPTIVLTSSCASEDVTQSYENYANAYVTKPVDPDEFIRAIRSLERFWTSTARLPRPPEP